MYLVRRAAQIQLGTLESQKRSVQDVGILRAPKQKRSPRSRCSGNLTWWNSEVEEAEVAVASISLKL